MAEIKTGIMINISSSMKDGCERTYLYSEKAKIDGQKIKNGADQKSRNVFEKKGFENQIGQKIPTKNIDNLSTSQEVQLACY